MLSNMLFHGLNSPRKICFRRLTLRSHPGLLLGELSSWMPTKLQQLIGLLRRGPSLYTIITTF